MKETEIYRFVRHRKCRSFVKDEHVQMSDRSGRRGVTMSLGKDKGCIRVDVLRIFYNRKNYCYLSYTDYDLLWFFTDMIIFSSVLKFKPTADRRVHEPRSTVPNSLSNTV